MAECTDYVVPKPNLEMVSPYPYLEAAAAAASSTEDSSSARTSSSEHDDRIILPVNPIKFANYPGPTDQKDVLEKAYSYFKKLPESEFDGIVKNNVIDIMKGLHGSEQYWMKKFHKEEIDGKERAAKIEKQKNATIEALEKRIEKLIAESIATESENQQNEKACNELKELNATLKAENEENVLKINELEEELKNAKQRFFAKDDEIKKMELQQKKYLQNLEKEIQKLDKEKQILQSEMQEKEEKEKTLNEKCSTLENEIAEFKRLNGGANDEIIKLQEQLQEMEKESESKMKISTEKEQSLKEKCSILENQKFERQKNFVEMNQKNKELIAELQLKMDKLEADKQSLIEKISAVESVENEKFEELNRKYAELEIKADETERSLTIANNEIINLKEKLIPGDAINGQLHDRAQNFEAHNSFLVFENNELKNSYSILRTSFATLKTEYEKLQKRLFSIEEYLKKYGNNLLPSIEKHQSRIEQISKEFERLNAKYEDEKNSAISKFALLIQQNIQHSEEKKIWITIFNDFCVKMNLLKNENVKLFGELKYYREAFSSGNDEVVVPTKRKRKSLNPQQKEVQLQQPNITEKIPDSNNNGIQFSAPESFASNNPGSSTQ